MSVIFASLFCLALSVIFTIKHNKMSRSHLNQPRPAIPKLGIQIICGNCAGDSERPVKTYLGHFNNCDNCGGHSYILAASCLSQHRWGKC